NMLDNFLKFARPEVPKLELVDIRAVSNYVVKLVEKELPKNTKIKKNYKDVPKVMIDPQQFEPVILNLILNAVQAMPEGGTINLNVNYDQERGAVCLEVQDNGVGIPLELLEKIFQPFFTTKKEGTGMGLAICTRIVDAHKGILEIESIEGEMTKVSIRLQTEFAEVKRSE
ncbi:MAG: ATP-binding protein, partial [Anaerovoracaceae bacterium]